MNNSHFRLLAFNAALILALGLLTGMFYGQVVIAELSQLPASIPGDIRAWKMAHMECLMNACLIFAIAAVAKHYQFTSAVSAVITYGLLTSGWTNAIASTLGAFTSARGAFFTGWDINSVVHILFLLGVAGIIVAVIALIIGTYKYALKTN